jgi:hypothetical protein
MNNAFFTFLKTKINANVPTIKTVQIWRGQTDMADSEDDKKRKQYSFPRPAVFIEFVPQETRNLSLGIQNVDLLIRFRFSIEHYTVERLQDLDFLDTFHNTMLALRGNSTDTVQFSSLQEVQTEQDSNFSNVDNPVIEYLTCWRKISGYKRPNTDVQLNPPIGTNLTMTKVNTLP